MVGIKGPSISECWVHSFNSNHLFLLCLKEKIFLVLENVLLGQPGQSGMILGTTMDKPPRNLRRKFPKFMPNHVLCNGDIVIDLPVVYLKLETNEVRKNSS